MTIIIYGVKMSIKNPDFVGDWNPYGDLAGGPQKFFMYITECEKKGGVESIKGTIEDSLGNASFEGELTEREIRFIKKYAPEAIRKGAAHDRVEYKGRKIKGLYAGEYTVIKGTVPQGVFEGVTQDWKCPFVMKECSDSSVN